MLKLLILLVVILGVIAVAQLARVYELTSNLRNKREEDVSLADNRLNAVLWIVYMVVFYIFFIWLMVKYGKPLPEAATRHGATVDWLMDVNLIIILIVFFVVNTLLFYFSAKYYYREDRKAKFFPHDNRLELAWTVVPSIVLTFIIIYGLRTWNQMTGPLEEGQYIECEVIGEQWKWYVRYAGQDGELGMVNWNLVDGAKNIIGVVHEDLIDAKIEEIDTKIEQFKADVDANYNLMAESQREVMRDEIYRLERHKQRILDIEDYDIEQGLTGWSAGLDDIFPKPMELHLPVDTTIRLKFRSKDVIHSAYMPHLRAQMNTVPGVPTEFTVFPTITTAEMRDKLDDPDFNYVLLCNKICGSAHYNMHIPVVIETWEEYNAYLAKQEKENNTFGVMSGLVEPTPTEDVAPEETAPEGEAVEEPAPTAESSGDEPDVTAATH